MQEHLDCNQNKTDKLASLLFDEISLKESIHYNAKSDKIIGVAGNGQICTKLHLIVLMLLLRQVCWRCRLCPLNQKLAKEFYIKKNFIKTKKKFDL